MFRGRASPTLAFRIQILGFSIRTRSDPTSAEIGSSDPDSLNPDPDPGLLVNPDQDPEPGFNDLKKTVQLIKIFLKI